MVKIEWARPLLRLAARVLFSALAAVTGRARYAWMARYLGRKGGTVEVPEQILRGLSLETLARVYALAVADWGPQAVASSDYEERGFYGRPELFYLVGMATASATCPPITSWSATPLTTMATARPSGGRCTTCPGWFRQRSRPQCSALPLRHGGTLSAPAPAGTRREWGRLCSGPPIAAISLARKRLLMRPCERPSRSTSRCTRRGVKREGQSW